MMSTLQHPLVVDYLSRLEAAAASLPPDSRAELVSDLGAHIEEATAHTDGSDEAIRKVLDRLGPPEEAAREAGASGVRQPWPAAPPADRGPVLEMWALGLLVGSLVLTVASLLVPVFPLVLMTWPALLALMAGLLLLALSPRWSVRDKLLGAAVYGLCGPPAVIASLTLPMLSYTEQCSGGTRPDGSTWEHCSGGAPTWAPWVGLALAVTLLAAWTWTTVHLHRKARATPQAPTPTGSAVVLAMVAIVIAMILLAVLAVAGLGAVRFSVPDTSGSGPVVVTQ